MTQIIQTIETIPDNLSIYVTQRLPTVFHAIEKYKSNHPAQAPSMEVVVEGERIFLIVSGTISCAFPFKFKSAFEYSNITGYTIEHCIPLEPLDDKRLNTGTFKFRLKVFSG